MVGPEHEDNNVITAKTIRKPTRLELIKENREASERDREWD